MPAFSPWRRRAAGLGCGTLVVSVGDDLAGPSNRELCPVSPKIGSCRCATAAMGPPFCPAVKAAIKQMWERGVCNKRCGTSVGVNLAARADQYRKVSRTKRQPPCSTILRRARSRKCLSRCITRLRLATPGRRGKCDRPATDSRSVGPREYVDLGRCRGSF